MMHLRKILISKALLLLLSFVHFDSNSVLAQNYDLLDIPFTVKGETLKNPFTGGFHGPQVENIDWNRDGIQDLLVFDRRGDVPLLFINDGLGNGSDSYSLNNEAQAVLRFCSQYVNIVDYNQDGIEDIITASQQLGSGIEVYRGIVRNNQLDFERFIHPYFASGEYDFNILTLDLAGQIVNLEILIGDRAAFEDIDFDGDIDMLAFNNSSYIQYFRNYAQEENLGNEAFLFRLENQCYGGAYESGLDEQITLSGSPDSCALGFSGNTGSSVRHAGSTILSFDEDGDQDWDLLIGDLSSSKMIFLRNGGTITQPWMNEQDENYPSYDFPINIDFWAGAYYEDVNSDGNRDLIAAPNGINKVINTDNIWYYENISSDESPDFLFRQKNFLTETTIDQGSYSIPHFVDLNSDGLIDLIVSSEGPFNGGLNEDLTIQYYENIGTANDPAYELVDDDFLNFSRFTVTSRFPALTSGDMDGDLDMDIIVGDSEGYLYYFENIGVSPSTPEFADPIYQWLDIDAGKFAKPTIFDVNRDGLNDLIVGIRATDFSEPNPNNPDDILSGNIRYYKNIGSPNNPQFETSNNSPNVNPGFGNIDTEFLSNIGIAAPTMVSAENHDLLITGGKYGRIWIHQTDLDSLDFGRFELVDTLERFIWQGEETAPTLADIDNDGWLEMAVGNFRGGIAIYNTIIRNDGVITSINEISEIGGDSKLFPNPFTDHIYFEDNVEKRIQVFDINGSLLRVQTVNNKVDLSMLTSGVYVMQINKDGVISTEKIIKL